MSETLPLAEAMPPPLMTVEEMREVYRVGIRRFHAARDRGATQRWAWLPSNAQRAETDGYSAIAECLVARYLGKEWLSSGTVPDAPEAGDVAGGVSVRWTPRANGSLIIHEDEVQSLLAVLVVGKAPDMELIGWLQVAEAMTPIYWRTEGVRHPAYFVPQAGLRPMSLLKEMLHA